jgi:hypothetical protein
MYISQVKKGYLLFISCQLFSKKNRNRKKTKIRIQVISKWSGHWATLQLAMLTLHSHIFNSKFLLIKEFFIIEIIINPTNLTEIVS